MPRCESPPHDLDQLIVLSNREPYQHIRTQEGELRAVRGSSGVVNAVEPVLLERGGVWVASGSGAADREAIEHADGVGLPPGRVRYRLRRVWLADAERRGYYEGFANSAMWPLCHRTSVAPRFDRLDFGWYEAVNRRFADAVAEEATVAAPVVFAHDYHFALAPRLIRRQLPLARIATFWHIPWPSPAVFERCPWSGAILEGLLGSTLVGFQTAVDRDHFAECARRAATVESNPPRVRSRGRWTALGVYPASVDEPERLALPLPAVAACKSDIRRELGLPQNTILGVGIDRLDYTKGLEEKLRAVERLLEIRPDLRGRFVFAQIAEPSRECVAAYRRTRERVFAIADRINARFADGCAPVMLLPTHHDRSSVFRFMRAADFCYVGSLHDGMNLVSKEFVAARDDECGVLVLSTRAGASRELRQALLVDPCKIEQVARALGNAIDMPSQEQRRRMRLLRHVVSGWTAGHWSAAILNDVRRLPADSATPARRECGEALVTAGARA
jgi:trehalose 6-phosphate synthase